MIAGNFIGTNAAGTAALGNGGNGVFVAEVGSANWIGVNPVYGAENADERNVISGNDYYGVKVYDSTQTVVAGNLIGTDVTGSTAIPNSSYGITLEDSSNNRVGTSGQDGAADALERNVISGNMNAGVVSPRPPTVAF